MKQTQTKLFDFSDVGLDFCAGSKNLFPDRFKNMLSLGYNVQTVLSVAVTGNQVTLTYGSAHGYVADRVLKVNSGVLTSINGGEFRIDSVTTNTVTMTIDDAPLSVTSGFTTKIAPLGWSLEYESANVHVYKFKDIDESDLYLRLVFQSAGSNQRNVILPCVGKTIDMTSGVITDNASYDNGRSATSPQAAVAKWEFAATISATYNNYTYSQGYSFFGKGILIGSQYHMLTLSNSDANTRKGVINGFVPAASFFPSTNYPLLLLYDTGDATVSTANTNLFFFRVGVLGNIRCSFAISNSNSAIVQLTPQAYSSFLSGQVDPFNTTTTEPLSLYELSTKQFLGYSCGGIYTAKYSSANQPGVTPLLSPSETIDVDFGSKVYVHTWGGSGVAGPDVFYAIPLEEIKYGA